MGLYSKPQEALFFGESAMVDPFDPDPWFARHLATLEASYTVKHQNKPHEHARNFYSGFLLCEKVPGTDMQATVWVTAGHCMQEIERDLLGRPESYGDIRFRFIDMLHFNSVSNLPMPFDYRGDDAKSWIVHTDGNEVMLGMDFGVVFLRNHDSHLLIANKLEPVDENNWVNVPETFDHYFMLGLPGELVRQDERGVWTAQPILIPIERLSEKPACYQEHTDAMFYGVVDPQERVKSIKGMSGGPILGLKRNGDGSGRYWFIGVQSGWYPSGRIVCATPLEAVRGILLVGMRMIFEMDVDDSASASWREETARCPI
jgi:hypothetical protein